MDKTTIDDLLNKEKYLDAAQIMKSTIPVPDFNQFIRDTLEVPRFQYSRLHRAILEIDPKIVITTNYDRIYDQYCTSGSARDGYNVCKYYDKHLVQDLRSPVRLVVKAHGCSSDPSQVILSRSDYFRARRDYSAFYNILDSIFITHTVLFIGYSLTDPDIQLVLENSHIAAPSTHPHYAFLSNDVPADIVDAMRQTYNIDVISFPANCPEDVTDAVEQMKEDVLSHRATNPQ